MLENIKEKGEKPRPGSGKRRDYSKPF